MNSDKLLIIDKILCFTAGGIMEELPLTCATPVCVEAGIYGDRLGMRVASIARANEYICFSDVCSFLLCSFWQRGKYQ